MIFRLVTLSLFLSISVFTYGQNAANKLGIMPNEKLNKNTKFTYEDIQLQDLDSSLHDFHRYNKASNWDYPYHYLGNVGANYLPLFYNNKRKSGLNNGFLQFENYLKKEKDIKYYDTQVPYTSLDLLMGKNDEYVFGGNYSQNINPNVNIGFDYDGIASDGFLNRMRSSIHNFDLYNWYHSKNRKYNLMTGLIINRVKIQENGGWTNQDVYKNLDVGRDIKLVPTNLSQAQNTIKDTRYYIRQTFYLGKEVEKKWGDSTVCVTDARFSLQHNMSIGFKNYTYSDNESTSNFYEAFYFDSIASSDQAKIKEFTNDLIFTNQKHFRDTSKNVFKVGVSHKLIQYKMSDRLAQLRNDFQIVGGWESPKVGKFSFETDGKISLSPQYLGDLDINFNTFYNINQWMDLRISINPQLSSPTLMEEQYQGNHYSWNNNFTKQFTLTTGAHFLCKKGIIKADLVNTLVRNPILLNQNSLPQQYSQWLNVLHFRASKAFDWKMFYLSVEVAAQYITDKSILRMPTFYTHNTFYYQGGFITGKLKAHLGFDIWYSTNNKTNAYNPALGQFYLQDNVVVSMYPVVDVFFRLNIKTLRLFFMLQNVNAGLFEKGYYVAPGYGAQGRAIKFGVNWRFYN